MKCSWHIAFLRGRVASWRCRLCVAFLVAFDPRRSHNSLPDVVKRCVMPMSFGQTSISHTLLLGLTCTLGGSIAIVPSLRPTQTLRMPRSNSPLASAARPRIVVLDNDEAITYSQVSVILDFMQNLAVCGG